LSCGVKRIIDPAIGVAACRGVRLGVQSRQKCVSAMRKWVGVDKMKGITRYYDE